MGADEIGTLASWTRTAAMSPSPSIPAASSRLRATYFRSWP
jgi:hypothetical protein